MAHISSPYVRQRDWAKFPRGPYELNYDSPHYTGIPGLIVPLDDWNLVRDLAPYPATTITVNGAGPGNIIGNTAMGGAFNATPDTRYISWIINRPPGITYLYPFKSIGASPKRVVFSCWFRFTDTAVSQRSFAHLGSSSTTDSTVAWSLFRRGNPSTFQPLFGGGYDDTSVDVNDLRWHFVSWDVIRDDIVWNNSRTTVYLDGVLVSDRAGGVPTIDDTNDRIWVGSGWPAGVSPVQVKDVRYLFDPFQEDVSVTTRSPPFHEWHFDLYKNPWDLYKPTIVRTFFLPVADGGVTGAGAQTLPLFSQAGVGVMQPVGAAAQTTLAILQAGSGVETISATAASNLAAVLQSGVGLMHPEGAAASLLASLIQAGSGEQRFTIAAAQILVILAQAGIGVMQPEGLGQSILAAILQDGVGVAGDSNTVIGVQTFASITQAATLLEIMAVNAFQTLSGITQDSTALMVPSGIVDQRLAAILQSASAQQDITGTSIQNLSAILQSAIALMQPAGIGSNVLAPVTQIASVSEILAAAASSTLPSVVQLATGELIVSGLGNSGLPAVTQLATGELIISGAAIQSLAAVLQSASLGLTLEAAAVQVLAAIQQEGIGFSPFSTFSGIGASILAAILQNAGVLMPIEVGGTVLSASFVITGTLRGSRVVDTTLRGEIKKS